MEKNNISVEPMDIDLSNQSVKDMDISYIDTDTDEKLKTRPSSSFSVSTSNDQLSFTKKSPRKVPVIKKYHINKQKPPRSSKNRLLKIIATVAAIIISTITYHVLNLNCCNKLNLEVLSETFSNNLFGQSAAVKLLINSLDLETKSKILFFFGGTGVGKTLTSSLILDTIGSCSNVYHYTMPTFESTFSTDFLFGLTMCKMAIIIVDDLTINDTNVKVHIKNVIEKSESLDNNITVILIYNCVETRNKINQKCDETFQNKLEDTFSEIIVLKRFIQFKPLSENHLRQCIQQELGNKRLNDLEFTDLLKNFNVSTDGCKAVHSKMKYLNNL